MSKTVPPPNQAVPGSTHKLGTAEKLLLSTAPQLAAQLVPGALTAESQQLSPAELVTVAASLKPSRLIPKKEAQRRTSCSSTQIWELQNKGQFPRARSLTSDVNSGRAYFLESEIDEFINSRPIRPIKADRKL